MNQTESAGAPPSIRLSRLLVLGSFYGLLLTFVVKTLLSVAAGDNATAMIVIGLVQTVPLLIFIPGVQAGHLRTHAWLSFVSLLYFTAAVTVAFTPGSTGYGIWLSLLCALLFSALVAFIRLMRKYEGGTLQN